LPGLKQLKYFVFFLAICTATAAGYAQQAQSPAVDLASMKIEDLMNVHVTSVSKQDQKMSQVAAAVFVIAQDDIRESGATTIPDLLRMVPGLNVAQINSNTWAISARGFNSQFADKLLVLVDGRTVYTPTLAEVFWDTLDVPLEDIERIEVIRGPGGTVWGANAVNGIINIITKEAGETLGGLLEAGGGTVNQGFGLAQYGAKTRGGGTAFRVFTKYFNRSHFPDFSGQNGHDGSHLLHGGFRADSTSSKGDSTMLQADLYSGAEQETIVHSELSPPQNITVPRHVSLSGGDILGSWGHSFSSRSDLTLQAYLDHYTNSGPEARETRDTVDIDSHYHLLIGSRNDLSVGMGYRYTRNRTVGTIDQAFVPPHEDGHLYNVFAEDQITLQPDRWFLYAGVKLEDNYFRGFAAEPSFRIAWTPSTKQTLWAAVSDAHRAPSYRDVGLKATLAALPGPAAVVLLGNRGFEDEVVLAYELGYRTQIYKRLSIDLASFFNRYYDLQSIEPLPPFIEPNTSPALLILPKTFANNLYGTTGGVEASVHWKVTDRWTVSPGYSFLKIHLHTKPASQDLGGPADIAGSNPVHQAQLRSHWEFARGFGWDANAYFTGPLTEQLVASYTRLDSQLTWDLLERVQLSLVGQNLLSDHHVEFNDDLALVNSSAIKRNVFAKIVWTF